MKAEVITIGDEILIGQTVDTNSAWIGSELSKIGIDLLRISSIPDQADWIVRTLSEAEARADLILITGGLGPTNDDITKSTLAEFFGTKLVRNERIIERIDKMFAQWGREPLEVNYRQADLPESATIIDNLAGTASGMWFDRDDKVFVSMPGVPYEMKRMMEETILPMIVDRFQTPEIIHCTVMTQGVGESFLAKEIEAWEEEIRSKSLSLAYLPSPGQVKLRITAKGLPNGQQLVREAVTSLADLIPQHIYGYDGVSLAEIVGSLLRQKGATLATAESCTGGFIAHQITSIAGSSDYFLGAIVSYANEVKMKQLGVKEADLMSVGAVSGPVVDQMAKGVRELLGADYSISTSGIAGPTGGTDEKPVGTVWIAVSGPNGTESKRFQFGRNRERNITITALTGLNMLRKMLKNEGA